MWKPEPLDDNFLQIFRPAKKYLNKVIIYYRFNDSNVVKPFAELHDSPSWKEGYTYYVHKKNTTKLFKLFYF